MEGQCGVWWGRAGTFSCCSTRSCSTEGKVANPDLFSSRLFYSILFQASFSSLLSFVVFIVCLGFFYTQSYLLTISILCAAGAAWEKEPGNDRWWLATTQQTAAAAGSLCSPHTAYGLVVLPVGRTTMCWHLGHSRAALEPTRVNPLPSSTAAACCRGAAPRSWRQQHFEHCRCLLSGCESVFNFRALCYLGDSSLISLFCPSCKWANRELYVPHVRCHLCWTKRK